MSKEQASFSTTVCGIPCGVVVDSYYYHPPSRKCAALCETPEEYYGDEQIEWHLIDRKGYNAEWLFNKMSETDIETLEEKIREEQNEDDRH